ncbi:MAG: hydrogenase 4 subunit B, partial [Epsilonproteobacteria bacterium]|nr:hydrogenase 4 subunit B [Campylobacterota bacterium]
MNNLNFLFTATFIIYIAGIFAVLLLPKKMTTKALSIFGSIGSLTLFVFATNILFGVNSYNISLWSILNIGKFTITVDHLSAFFLIVTAIVALPASVFASTRLDNNPKDHNGFLAALFLSLLIAIVLVLTASHVFFFLLSWEVMSILIYFLVNSGKEEHSGYVMLAIGESGTLAILISLLLLSTNAGTLSFAGLSANASSLSAGLQWAIFILSFFGFGIKAGLIPLNFWIPRAYTAAPSAFIPIIAGATLNLGLYGIIRINIDFLSISEVGIGVVILIVGAMTAIVGILYATIEDDFKTVLAHSSIENAGIITTALGASVIFLTTGHKVVASMALVAALYHLLNHSVFKTLLFMGAGTLEEASGSRSLNQLGGLLKKMPWTGFFVLIGVLSISAMPPFNGFASEWLILESLLRSVELSSFGVKIAFIIAGATLALTAGLAVTCFVRLFAMSFLGMPRTKSIQKAKEATKSTLASMAFLAFMSLS